MRSLAIVISRCVCKVARLGGRPFAIKGAIIQRKKKQLIPFYNYVSFVPLDYISFFVSHH
jgi:hypothetical protein